MTVDADRSNDRYNLAGDRFVARDGDAAEDVHALADPAAFHTRWR